MNAQNNKQKLFEMMEKLNPEINITEQFGQQQPAKTLAQPAQPVQPAQPGDVKSLSRANQTSTIQSAAKRINTSLEFPEAFRVWFSSLGYKPDNPAISIMKVKSEIEKVMKSMGYK